MKHVSSSVVSRFRQSGWLMPLLLWGFIGPVISIAIGLSFLGAITYVCVRIPFAGMLLLGIVCGIEILVPWFYAYRAFEGSTEADPPTPLGPRLRLYGLIAIAIILGACFILVCMDKVSMGQFNAILACAGLLMGCIDWLLYLDMHPDKDQRGSV